MVVLHFKYNYAHRISVLYLYRNILRSAKGLNLDNEFKDIVRTSFKRGSRLTSPWNSANALAKASKLFSELQSLIKNNATQPLDWKKMLLVAQDENVIMRQKNIYKIPSTEKLSHNVAPSKINQKKVSRIQSLKSKIRRYLFKYENKHLSEKSINLTDKPFVEILTKLQHKRCLKELRRLDYLFNYKGPFKVKVVNLQLGPNVGFIQQLNLPFKHNRALSYYITTAKKYQAELLLDTKEKYFLVKSEADWEFQMYKLQHPQLFAKLNDLQKSKLQQYFVKQWLFVDTFSLKSLSKKYHISKKRSAVFMKRCPSLKKSYQEKFNNYFYEGSMKYKKLMEDVKRIADLSDSSNPLLYNSLKKYGFIKNDVEWYI